MTFLRLTAALPNQQDPSEQKVEANPQFLFGSLQFLMRKNAHLEGQSPIDHQAFNSKLKFLFESLELGHEFDEKAIPELSNQTQIPVGVWRVTRDYLSHPQSTSQQINELLKLFHPDLQKEVKGLLDSLIQNIKNKYAAINPQRIAALTENGYLGLVTANFDPLAYCRTYVLPEHCTVPLDFKGANPTLPQNGILIGKVKEACDLPTAVVKQGNTCQPFMISTSKTQGDLYQSAGRNLGDKSVLIHYQSHGDEIQVGIFGRNSEKRAGYEIYAGFTGHLLVLFDTSIKFTDTESHGVFFHSMKKGNNYAKHSCRIYLVDRAVKNSFRSPRYIQGLRPSEAIHTVTDMSQFARPEGLCFLLCDFEANTINMRQVMAPKSAFQGPYPFMVSDDAIIKFMNDDFRSCPKLANPEAKESLFLDPKQVSEYCASTARLLKTPTDQTAKTKYRECLGNVSFLGFTDLSQGHGPFLANKVANLQETYASQIIRGMCALSDSFFGNPEDRARVDDAADVLQHANPPRVRAMPRKIKRTPYRDLPDSTTVDDSSENRNSRVSP